MKIKGLQKTTLLDYPGKVACTVFTFGCNFRCPFCHNASLVINESDGDLSEQQFFSFLEKRKGILDGVCITGGEPLLHKDIVPFIEKIHSMGFLVKLDTNGAFPERLKEIISLGIIDYVAMDIKNVPDKYAQAIGLLQMPEGILESIALLKQSNIEYEFRTTVVEQLHTKEDILGIAQLIEGAKQYYLQRFKDSGELIEEGYSAHSEQTMREMLELVKPYVCVAGLRGMEE
ncbi:MAG: anaerobic ribonucleoside-triphosphate reductase activating protein [Ruminococcaceae bacterium]|nr:anaerobic ribonucleoside-triphosphate reductase activating protein [Oscillospiraceae bacterium]